MLSRDYSYAKWDLIETLELELKLTKALNSQQNFRDLLQRLHLQFLSLSNAVHFSMSNLTYAEVLKELARETSLEKPDSLIDVYRHNIAAQFKARA